MGICVGVASEARTGLTCRNGHLFGGGAHIVAVGGWDVIGRGFGCRSVGVIVLA